MWVIFALLDPDLAYDPDPGTPLNPIRIRIHNKCPHQGDEEVEPGNGGGESEGDQHQEQPQTVLSLQMIPLRHPAQGAP